MPIDIDPREIAANETRAQSARDSRLNGWVAVSIACLATFLAVSFAVTWSAWGILVPLARARTLVYGQWPFMVLYMLGGLGPTIGAYAAVLASSAQAPLRRPCSAPILRTNT